MNEAVPIKPPAHELELAVIGLRKEWLAPNGRLVDASEVYPGSEDWGSRGWSFPIRLREWVFELARRMATIGPPYGKWVRKELGVFKDRGKSATVQEVASR
jgi:hypothetical protein